MKHTKNSSLMSDVWYFFCYENFPNRQDNIGRIILKSVFIIALCLLIAFFCFITVHFVKINKQQSLITETKETYMQLTADGNTHPDKALKYFQKQNSDLKGWITVSGTSLNNPIYQTYDNEFYRTRNQLKETSSFGSLYFDCEDSITEEQNDNYLVVYGNNLEEDELFSCLDSYKSMYFYKQNPYIKLSTLYGTDTYIIYACFVINSYKEHDGGYVFDYKNPEFETEEDFSEWANEITERSLYHTGIDIHNDDEILTLVTDSSEFEAAKLVVMARKLRDGDNINLSLVSVNKTPRYPEIYYKEKGLKYPFDTNKTQENQYDSEEEQYVS